MKRLTPMLILSALIAACGGGGTTPTPVTPGTVGPAPGTAVWLNTYLAATAATCPAATPASDLVTITVAPGGSSMTWSDSDLGTSITFTRDATGAYVWAEANARMSFRFVSATHAEGEAQGIHPPCSATWPTFLDRQ
jgi:hypothetical protein